MPQWGVFTDTYKIFLSNQQHPLLEHWEVPRGAMGCRVELFGCLISAITSFFDPSLCLKVFNSGVRLPKIALGRKGVNPPLSILL